MSNYWSNFEIAVEAILANKMRSILTALGIIFGVAAVIAMLAIGNGAQQEILDQMKLVGVNNIVIQPLVEQNESSLAEEENDSKETNRFSPGLSLSDLHNIETVLPNIAKITPEIVNESYIIRNGVRRSAKLIGVEPSYFSIYNFELAEGSLFNETHLKYGKPVCIIGNAIKTRFFSQENPIGKKIKCGSQWLTVVGVLQERLVSSASMEKLGIRNSNLDVFMPTKTMLMRYHDPAKITKQSIQKSQSKWNKGKSKGDLNQLDKIVVQVNETEELAKTAEIVQRILKRRHNEKIDFEVTVPELLLKQQQRTKDIFNIVLGAIAGISLIVGGIGIMNIMLASVMERIKEIGLRIAIGAKRKDIVQQFLFEAVLISLTGGVIGIILGIAFAIIISMVADIPTIISAISIVISFGVATAVGVIFGITPAKRAAKQDPIKSLRYE